VRFDHVARIIIKPESQRDVTGCDASRIRLRVGFRCTTSDRMATHRRLDRRSLIAARVNFVGIDAHKQVDFANGTASVPLRG
jgi:hypothetical protein